MATELGERIKHESEKLRALELVTMPLHKKEEPKGGGKLKMFTLIALCVGVGFAIFRKLRGGQTEQTTFTPRAADTPERTGQDHQRDQRLATAGL